MIFRGQNWVGEKGRHPPVSQGDEETHFVFGWIFWGNQASSASPEETPRSRWKHYRLMLSLHFLEKYNKIKNKTAENKLDLACSFTLILHFTKHQHLIDFITSIVPNIILTFYTNHSVVTEDTATSLQSFDFVSQLRAWVSFNVGFNIKWEFTDLLEPPGGEHESLCTI